MSISREDFMRVSKAVITRWAELACQEIDSDINNMEGILDECYLSALWSKRVDLLLEISDLIAKTDDIDKRWQLVEEVYGGQIGSPAKKLQMDIASRLEWLKKLTAQDFERDIKTAIYLHGITSPIEQLFLMEWKFGRINEKWGVKLLPQKPIETSNGKYIVDFHITTLDSSDSIINVAIEIDGHEFHEKSKSQVAKDKKRDRALIRSGLTVLRFSGSEVFYEPKSCINEIVDYIKKAKANKG